MDIQMDVSKLEAVPVREENPDDDVEAGSGERITAWQLSVQAIVDRF